jgi:formaldehyde-activating enzyme
MDLDALDGTIGQGWGGLAPNGTHVNVILARRGSATAAAAMTMFAQPSPGHTPVMVCVGERQVDYEPIWPPTLMMNKSTALEERYQTLTWGAAQLGIGQGVLDAVAAGLIEATNELIVTVSVWIDPAAHDETALRHACREATLAGIDECVNGRTAESLRRQLDGRDSLQSPFYHGD